MINNCCSRKEWIFKMKEPAKLIQIICLVLAGLMVLSSCKPAKPSESGNEPLDPTKFVKSDGIEYVSETNTKLTYSDFVINEDFGHWSSENTLINCVAVGNGGDIFRNNGQIGGTCTIYKPGEKLIDYSVQYTIDKAGVTDVYGILLRASGAQNCLQFSRYGKGFQLILIEDGITTTLTTNETGRMPSTETLKAEIEGYKFTGYSNGSVVLEYEFDEDLLPAFGNFGIQTNHNHAGFRNLKVDIKKSEKASSDTPDVKIESIELSQNQVGRQDLKIGISGNQTLENINTVSSGINAIVNNQAFGGTALTKGQSYKATEVSLEIDKSEQTASAILRASGDGGKDGYISFGRYYDNIALYHSVAGKAQIIKYYPVPEKVDLTSLVGKIDEAGVFTGFANGVQVIRHDFKNTVNAAGNAGVSFSLQGSAAAVKINGGEADLSDQLGVFSKDGGKVVLKNLVEGDRKSTRLNSSH